MGDSVSAGLSAFIIVVFKDQRLLILFFKFKLIHDLPAVLFKFIHLGHFYVADSEHVPKFSLCLAYLRESPNINPF